MLTQKMPEKDLFFAVPIMFLKLFNNNRFRSKTDYGTKNFCPALSLHIVSCFCLQ